MVLAHYSSLLVLVLFIITVFRSYFSFLREEVLSRNVIFFCVFVVIYFKCVSSLSYYYGNVRKNLAALTLSSFTLRMDVPAVVRKLRYFFSASDLCC